MAFRQLGCVQCCRTNTQLILQCSTYPTNGATFFETHCLCFQLYKNVNDSENINTLVLAIAFDSWHFRFYCYE